ncbi:hypothetical protein H6P81_003492 [Aristolochia fimbriata]|uniref:Uncharacterized protein n=1 Tax=Aristolochia fimbriata TaxID=158543 RepID=A0AAV7FD81_ARIFI|nr:hypothetical protein H6P81_003492 [Aristolochia fimbriata]
MTPIHDGKSPRDLELLPCLLQAAVAFLMWDTKTKFMNLMPKEYYLLDWNVDHCEIEESRQWSGPSRDEGKESEASVFLFHVAPGGGEMVTESWLSRVGNSLWARRRRPVGESPAAAKASVGVLSFEVGSLMSKVVQLWYSLADEQIARLRDETLQHPGVRKLVSDDDDYLLSLALAEMVDNLACAARTVARLGRRCSNPLLQRLENLFDEMVRSPETGASGWEFNWKKMKRKVKKMEKFVATSSNLYQEMEVLTELEQGLRRMQANGADQSQGTYVEFQRKVVGQRQEVKYLRENSLWNRSLDYVIRLLTRSLFTVLARIKHVFGIYPVVGEFVGDSKALNHLPRSQSISALGQSLVHPSESHHSMKFASGPLNRFDPMSFASGPLGRSSGTKSGPLVGQWRSKIKRSSANKGAAFKGCITAGPLEPPPRLNTYTSVDNLRSNGFVSGTQIGTKEFDLFALFTSKRRLSLSAPPSTLGAAALALHYANVIIVIEKMVTYPHLIAPDAREDLYNMLPTNIRAALRARLKSCGKSSASLVYDPILVGEWNEALGRILEWLSPLAHNMIRWQSERSFEQQHLASNTNVLLLQTLYFANQAKTESVITELLMCLRVGFGSGNSSVLAFYWEHEIFICLHALMPRDSLSAIEVTVGFSHSFVQHIFAIPGLVLPQQANMFLCNPSGFSHAVSENPENFLLSLTFFMRSGILLQEEYQKLLFPCAAIEVLQKNKIYREWLEIRFGLDEFRFGSVWACPPAATGDFMRLRPLVRSSRPLLLIVRWLFPTSKWPVLHSLSRQTSLVRNLHKEDFRRFVFHSIKASSTASLSLLGRATRPRRSVLLRVNSVLLSY